jgi:Tubulin-tyrosine ligase family
MEALIPRFRIRLLIKIRQDPLLSNSLNCVVSASWSKNTLRSQCYSRSANSILEHGFSSLLTSDATFLSKSIQKFNLLFFLRECYVRTSCEDYDLGQDNLDKIYVHLTNNAIQKFSDNYGKFEDGNQISLQELAVRSVTNNNFLYRIILLHKRPAEV